VHGVAGRPEPFGGGQHPWPEAKYGMKHNHLSHSNSSHQDDIPSPRPFPKGT
jgi:hypothetical protein